MVKGYKNVSVRVCSEQNLIGQGEQIRSERCLACLNSHKGLATLMGVQIDLSKMARNKENKLWNHM